LYIFSLIVAFAKNTWMIVSDLLGVSLGCDFESVARFWLANKRHGLTNVISAAVMWSLWKLRNEIYFQGTRWTGMARLFLKIVRMLRRWMPLFKQELGCQVESFASRLEIHASLPPQIMWKTVETSTSSELALSAALHSDTNAHLAQHEAVVSEHVCVGPSCSVSAIRPESVG